MQDSTWNTQEEHCSLLLAPGSWILTYQYIRTKTPSGSFEDVWAAFFTLFCISNSQLNTPSHSSGPVDWLISPAHACCWVQHTSGPQDTGGHTTDHAQSLICTQGKGITLSQTSTSKEPGLKQIRNSDSIEIWLKPSRETGSLIRRHLNVERISSIDLEVLFFPSLWMFVFKVSLY